MWARAYRTYREQWLTVWKECLSLNSSYLKGNFRGTLGFKWSRFLLLHWLFIVSGTVHPSGFDGSLNSSLFLLITTFQRGYKVLHLSCVFFRWQVSPSTLLTWPNISCPSPEYYLLREAFCSRLRTLQAVGGECRGGWPQTSVCQRSVTCITQGHIIFKACRLQHVIRPKKKNRQTSCIPEPIPQSTITSLNSSTLDGGARAHPVVLAALPAHAAQSVFPVAMATGKHCTHA